MRDKRPPISGVILAAGRASRMGRAKQLLQFRGKTILDHVIDNALRSSLDQVVVVLGYCAERIQREVDFSRVKVLLNTRYEMGQSTSLMAGLTGISDDCVAAVFILGDQPLVGPELIDTLIEAYHRESASLVIPTCRGRRGNPVLIDRSLFGRLESIEGDVGARALFDAYSERIVEIEVEDDAIHLDVDTWADYDRLKTGG